MSEAIRRDIEIRLRAIDDTAGGVNSAKRNVAGVAAAAAMADRSDQIGLAPIRRAPAYGRLEREVRDAMAAELRAVRVQTARAEMQARADQVRFDARQRLGLSNAALLAGGGVVGGRGRGTRTNAAAGVAASAGMMASAAGADGIGDELFMVANGLTLASGARSLMAGRLSGGALRGMVRSGSVMARGAGSALAGVGARFGVSAAGAAAGVGGAAVAIVALVNAVRNAEGVLNIFSDSLKTGGNVISATIDAIVASQTGYSRPEAGPTVEEMKAKRDQRRAKTSAELFGMVAGVETDAEKRKALIDEMEALDKARADIQGLDPKQQPVLRERFRLRRIELDQLLYGDQRAADGETAEANDLATTALVEERVRKEQEDEAKRSEDRIESFRRQMAAVEMAKDREVGRARRAASDTGDAADEARRLYGIAAGAAPVRVGNDLTGDAGALFGIGSTGNSQSDANLNKIAESVRKAEELHRQTAETLKKILKKMEDEELL